jgi:hypothetical protein
LRAVTGPQTPLFDMEVAPVSRPFDIPEPTATHEVVLGQEIELRSTEVTPPVKCISVGLVVNPCPGVQTSVK